MRRFTRMSPVILILSLLFAVTGIQEQRAVAPDFGEVKHLSDGVGDSVERALADALATQPIVFDEADDRTLIGDGVIDEILFRPRGDHDQRLSGAVAAASERVQVRGINPRQ